MIVPCITRSRASGTVFALSGFFYLIRGQAQEKRFRVAREDALQPRGTWVLGMGRGRRELPAGTLPDPLPLTTAAAPRSTELDRVVNATTMPRERKYHMPPACPDDYSQLPRAVREELEAMDREVGEIARSAEISSDDEIEQRTSIV